MGGIYNLIGICSLTFIVGLLICIKAGRMNYKRHKQNFENTNTSGVVEYENYDQYAKSQNQGTLIGCLGKIGGLIWGLSLCALVFLIVRLFSQ